MTTDIYSKDVLIFGCGNTLFGNDGFGPAVIEHLTASENLADDILALDAGTGIRDFMFDLLLMEKKPSLVIVIDAVTVDGRREGELFELSLDAVPREKMSDFSLHQSPSSNLLKELEAGGGVTVKVLGVQTEPISNEISPGLSDAVKKAVPEACLWLREQLEHRNCP